MRALRQTIHPLLRKSLIALGVLFAGLACLLGPVETIVETIDIISMRGSTSATIVRSQVKRDFEESRPEIHYEYVVGGVTYEGKRYMPGFAANIGHWSGGGSAAERYRPGQAVTIHYRPDDPAHACLEYGWFIWPVGWWLFTWGILWIICSDARWILAIWREPPDAALGLFTLLAGMALIAFHPNAILVRYAAWYVAAYLLCVIILHMVCRRIQGPEPNQSAGAIEDAAGVNDDD